MTISTRQQTNVEAEDDRHRIQQQKAEEFEPTPPADIFGEDYDFPQTNQSIQEIVEDDCNDDLQEEQQENTTNMEQLAKDQRNDPTLTDVWKRTESKDPEFSIISFEIRKIKLELPTLSLCYV